jgi:hypothetical protein
VSVFVVDLSCVDVSVVRCFGCADALSGVPRPDGCLVGRVSRDEILILAPKNIPPLIRDNVQGSLGDESLAVDHSAAFAVWLLRGEEFNQVFGRISAIPLGNRCSEFAQGLVANVPAKVFALTDRIYILVPSTLEHVIPDFLSSACNDLELTIGGRLTLGSLQAVIG